MTQTKSTQRGISVPQSKMCVINWRIFKIMSGKENICEQSKSPSMLHVQSKLHQNKSDMNQHPSIQPLQPTKTQYIRSHMANKLLEHYGKLSTHLTLNIFDLMATH